MRQSESNIVRSTWSGAIASPEKVPDAADVVIIGGGIVGVSTAWFLAQAGVKVVLCEKGHIAGEQSGRNWGWVRVQGRDTREIPMMLESLRIWDDLQDRTGEDVGFTRQGCYFTANSRRELADFDAWMQVADEFGIETRLLDAATVNQHMPHAALPWAGALWTASDGRAEPHKAVPAMARAAERDGARILTGCAVRGIERNGGQIAGVVTEAGTIRTQQVLCAAGAWTSLFCGSLDVDVPQLRVRGTVARTAPGTDVIGGNLFDKRLGIRRRQDGGYTVAHGSILEHLVTPSSFRYFRKFLPALRQEMSLLRLRFGKEFFDEWSTGKKWSLDEVSPFEKTRVLNPSASKGALRGIRKNLDTLYPVLSDTPIVESWAGMIEASPDIVPIIGGIDDVPGFYIATGFSGHGFGIGPGAGKAIAAMLQGRSDGIDLSAFRLSRFFDGSPILPQSSI